MDVAIPRHKLEESRLADRRSLSTGRRRVQGRSVRSRWYGRTDGLGSCGDGRCEWRPHRSTEQPDKIVVRAAPQVAAGREGYAVQAIVDGLCDQGLRTPGGSRDGLWWTMRRLAGVQGFEPQLPDPESGVLPLDDTPMNGEFITGTVWRPTW